jgi:hypothetical protein
MNACNPLSDLRRVGKLVAQTFRRIPFPYILIVVNLLQLTACSTQLEKEDYVAWVTDYQHDLHVKKDYSEFTFDVQYQPLDYAFILQEHQPTAEDLEVFKKNNKSIQHYILKVALKSGGADIISVGAVDAMDRQQNLYYFSYRFQDDISLEENGRIIPCTLFHFERQSDLSGAQTFVLGFDNAADHKDASDGEAHLVIRSPYFSSLPIKIKVSKNNIPSLVL